MRLNVTISLRLNVELNARMNYDRDVILRTSTRERGAKLPLHLEFLQSELGQCTPFVGICSALFERFLVHSILNT